jgi:hypothetical protein
MTENCDRTDSNQGRLTVFKSKVLFNGFDAAAAQKLMNSTPKPDCRYQIVRKQFTGAQTNQPPKFTALAQKNNFVARNDKTLVSSSELLRGRYSFTTHPLIKQRMVGDTIV